MSTIKQSREERVFENEVRGPGAQTHYYYLHAPIYNHVADSRGIYLLIVSNLLALRRTGLFYMRNPSKIGLSQASNIASTFTATPSVSTSCFSGKGPGV